MGFEKMSEKYLAVITENEELAEKVFAGDGVWKEDHVDFLSLVISSVTKAMKVCADGQLSHQYLATLTIDVLSDTFKAIYLHGYLAGKASSLVFEVRGD